MEVLVVVGHKPLVLRVQEAAETPRQQPRHKEATVGQAVLLPQIMELVVVVAQAQRAPTGLELQEVMVEQELPHQYLVRL
jgi:hypothetical protein